MTTSHRLTPGTRFGPYEIIREIGVGSGSVYYLAAGGVALRVFWAHPEDHDFLTLLVDDAGLARILDHPNLVRFLAGGQQADGQFFLAHEYIDGRSVLDIRRRRNCAAWPLGAAVALALGMTAGLVYLHDKTAHDGRPLHWVHRTLDPTTVFVTRDGIVKINDVGLARVPRRRPGVLGPRISRYLSPEQARGLPLDRRSDLFSLGTLVYELTTGQRPFEGPDDFSMLTAIVKGPLAPPSQRVAGYSPGLERIVVRALDRDRDRRYQTAGEVERDLRELAHAESLDVSPGTLAALV